MTSESHQANVIMQNPTAKNHFHNMLNEPLPPTPHLGPTSQQQQPSMFISQQQQQQQQQSPASSSSAMNGHRREAQQPPPNIVGPSDHYGMHLQYNNNNSNNASENLSAKPFSANFKNPNHPNDETKVCVIVDSRTPVVFKIPVPPSRITLGDLKRALSSIDQPNYKYFFKSNDSEFGIVKEEIQDDDGQLPTYRNRVVAWIVTPGRIGDEFASKSAKSDAGTCNLTYSNMSYDDGSSSLMTTDIESTSYFTETDEDSISCSNYSETTCDTFVSQRRNRNYGKSNGKSPVNHYHDHRNNSPYRSYNNQHDRNRNLGNISPSSSSTSSSASQSDATAVHCLTVHLVLTKENFFGVSIYPNVINEIDEGIYVDEVKENSVVALDGRIERGDKLIQVNEINLEELSNDEAIRVLREVVHKRGPLKLVVAKFIETSKNEAIDGIVGPKEAIHPIDTAAWVAHAQAITIPNSHEQANSATSSPSFDSNARDTDCIRPASAGMARLSPGLRLNRGIADIQEILQHMKQPEVGLQIKDREWLKIHIPKAFLGSELVTWLERNIYGFNSSREAKKFASRMLKEGYIRDPISKKSFSSKSYYTFVI